MRYIFAIYTRNSHFKGRDFTYLWHLSRLDATQKEVVYVLSRFTDFKLSWFM